MLRTKSSAARESVTNAVGAVKAVNAFSKAGKKGGGDDKGSDSKGGDAKGAAAALKLVKKGADK